MADSFAKIETTIRRKSRRQSMTNLLLAALLVAFAYIIYRHFS